VTPPIRSRLGVLLVATTLVVAACGLRTPVRPPEDTAPVIPGTPTVTREADSTVVRWKRATRSADDMRLEDLASFVVERRSSTSDGWTPVGTIDVVDQEKIRRRDNFAWRDTDASAAGASYRVIAVTADGQQGPPNEAVADPVADEPASAPAPDVTR
jgi:predicted small lipoprotein YifL